MPIDTWPEWQRAYVHGLILLFPPEPVRSLVDDLRAKYDPRSHAICPAHISLTVPAPRPLTPDALRDLEDVAARHGPLRIRHGPVHVFAPSPVVTLWIEPQEGLRRLVADLEAVPAFAGAPPRRFPFVAHMTIAEFIDAGTSRRLVEELGTFDLAGEFTCSHVSVAMPDDDFRFSERHRLALGGGSGP